MGTALDGPALAALGAYRRRAWRWVGIGMGAVVLAALLAVVSGFDVESRVSSDRMVGTTMIYLVMGGVVVAVIGLLMMGRAVRQRVHLASAIWRPATLEAAKLPVRRRDRQRSSPLSQPLLLLRMADVPGDEVLGLYSKLRPSTSRSGLADASRLDVAFAHGCHRRYAVVREAGGGSSSLCVGPTRLSSESVGSPRSAAFPGPRRRRAGEPRPAMPLPLLVGEAHGQERWTRRTELDLSAVQKRGTHCAPVRRAHEVLKQDHG